MIQTVQEINKELRKRYESIEVNGTQCFLAGSVVVRVDTFQGCFVVEYANNIDEAEKNIFEDGDLIEITENSLENIISEIEDSKE